MSNARRRTIHRQPRSDSSWIRGQTSKSQSTADPPKDNGLGRGCSTFFYFEMCLGSTTTCTFQHLYFQKCPRILWFASCGLCLCFVCAFDLPSYMTTGVYVDVILNCFFSCKDRASERDRPYRRKKNYIKEASSVTGKSQGGTMPLPSDIPA